MSRSNPKIGPSYVHIIGAEQAVADGISGNAFLMLGWVHEFCRRRKRDVLTTKEFHMSGVAIDRRTIRKYLGILQSAEHIEKVSRGRWRVLSLGRVGYKHVPGANNATKNVPLTQSLKTDFDAPSVPLNVTIQESSAPALLNQKDLSQRLKADEPPASSAAAAPQPLAAAATREPEPAFVEVASAPKLHAVAEAKTQVVRQAGSKEKQSSCMADTFLSMGVLASGKSIEDLLAMQAVDLDDLDTEAILAQDRREAARLGTHQRVPARKAPGRAVEALPRTGPTPIDTEAFTAPPAPQTTQRLPASVIRHTLGQMAEAIPEFVFGEKEVNALRKWPVTQAQLVDLKNVAVARKRQGKLMMGVGAYLYGAVRRASLGLLPARRGAEVHLAGALGPQAGPLS